jgi:hypothetical protein
MRNRPLLRQTGVCYTALPRQGESLLFSIVCSDDARAAARRENRELKDFGAKS